MDLTSGKLNWKREKKKVFKFDLKVSVVGHDFFEAVLPHISLLILLMDLPQIWIYYL